MKEFILAFVPIFVAVDAIGTLPLYIGLTEGMKKKERYYMVLQSIITALFVAISFLFVGKAIFSLLGITIADFMVAGGLLLFAISLMDLLTNEKKSRKTGLTLPGVVPLGTPLIVGPAVLTTALMLVDIHGMTIVIAATIVNILLAGLIFIAAGFFTRILGLAGTKAVSKVASLILAAIAIMMVRKGITRMISNT